MKGISSLTRTRSLSTIGIALLALGAGSAAAAVHDPTPTTPDLAAPVLSHHQISINAPVSKVWKIFTNVDNWPTWQSNITAAQLNGKVFGPGNSFTWTSEGFTVTSHIHIVKKQSMILWSGVAQGITGIHLWIFQPTATGTRVVTTESFAGQPVDDNLDLMQGILDTTLPFWLNALKADAETPAP
jgi:uncharacterized membrane protein